MVTNYSGQATSGSGTFYLQGQTPPDTTAPTVPAGLAATPASATQINLSWTASTDGVGVTAYKVYRGGSLLATLGNVTSYSDTGLTASTAYSYTVSACDAAGNCSAQSTAASATTSAAPDTTAPTVPAGLAATPASATQINLSWTASTDGVGVTAYKVYRGGSLLATLGNVTSYSDTGLTASTAYSYTVSACDAAANCSAQSAAASATTTAVTASSSRLINISTRGQVQTGNNVMIGGLIISGSTPKTVLIRAVGPNLANYGVPGVLANPKLDLYSGQTVIASNDDWGSAANATAIQATGLAPVSSLEAAILTTLNPGAYTAIVSGANGGTGVGIVEAFEVDNPGAPLINISTRGPVLTGDNVMIGGFIIQGTASQTVLIRAVGPNLANYGVTGVLANPKLDLYSGQTVIASNDDWGSAANAAAIQATGLAPVSPLEAAILITLNPGAYTAIVSGVGGGTGVGIVEVFAQ